MSQKLTPKLVRKLYPEQNSKDVVKLQLGDKGITEVGDLTTLRSLIRLDLNKNSIQSISFAATCTGLKWLSLANNPVSDLSPLSSLQDLQVLNVGHAKLVGKVKIGALTSLGALILNDNALTSISGLKEIKGLNTLVLKNNAFEDLGTSLHHCTALSKLSMAHNQVSDLGNTLQGCTSLRELRLNHNALTALPQGLSVCRQLRIVDLGANPISALQPIKILAQLPNLQNLTLKGCPVTEQQTYPKCVIDLLPQLHILDNQKVSSGSHNKQPATVKHGITEASVPGKNDKQIFAKADIAQAEEEQTGRQAPPQLKAKSSKLVMKSSDAPLDAQESRQATKRKHAETASEAPPCTEVSEQHNKKRKARSTTEPAAEAGAFAQARLTSGLTFKATKSKSKQNEVSIPGSTITPKAPGTTLKILEDKAGPAADMKRSKDSSGAQPPHTAAPGTDQAGIADCKTSKQQKPATAAAEPARKVAISTDGLSSADIKTKPQQKAAKGAASIGRHKAGATSHALAIGKEAAIFLQRQLDSHAVAEGADAAWSWAAPGQEEAPLSTWS